MSTQRTIEGTDPYDETILIYCDDQSANTPGLHRGRRRIERFFPVGDSWQGYNTREGQKYRLRCDRCGLDADPRQETLKRILDGAASQGLRELSLRLLIKVLAS